MRIYTVNSNIFAPSYEENYCVILLLLVILLIKSSIQNRTSKSEFSFNKVIMIAQYSQQDEDKFVKDLRSQRSKQETVRSLKASVATLQKSKLGSSLKNLPDQIMKQRFGQHFSLLKHSIQNLSGQCHKYGGLPFIKAQMDKNQITKQEYVNYCMSRLDKNFQLPQIKVRSASQKTLETRSRSNSERNSKMQYNKWYIKPEQRFSKSKEKTKYDWNKESFILNVVRAKGNFLQHQYLPKFISNCKQKLNRQPLLCRHTTIKKIDR